MAENKDILNETLDETVNESIDESVSAVQTTDAVDADEQAEKPAAADETAVSVTDDASEDEDDDDDDGSAEYENDFFKKLAELPPKKAKAFQIVYGIVCGVLCFGALCVEQFFPRIDQLVKYGILGVVVILIFLSFNMGKKTKWDMIPYRVGLACGIGLGIIIYTVYLIVTGQKLF